MADTAQSSRQKLASDGEVLLSAFRLARREAAIETGLDLEMFPAICPWTYDQAVGADFWPD